METQDNNTEQKNEVALPIRRLKSKELQVIQMKYLGKTSFEIAQVSGYEESYVRRLFMQGGRLEKAYEEFADQQRIELQKAANAVMEVARSEAESAINRMVELSKNSDNEAVVLKASQYILEIIGVSQNPNLSNASPEAALREILKSMGREQAKKAVDGLFQELFGVSPQRSFSIHFHVLGEPTNEAVTIGRSNDLRP